MKTAVKFLIHSLLVGVAVIAIVLVISYPVFLSYDYFSERFEWYYLLIGIGLAIGVGTITTNFYVAPINFAADVFLKIYTSFYNEFFKQGAKYFARENKNRPFEKVVEIKLSDEIRILGFLTNSMSSPSKVVFIPTSRRLTSGINLVVKSSNIKTLDIKPEDFLKFIVTSGAYGIESEGS